MTLAVISRVVSSSGIPRITLLDVQSGVFFVGTGLEHLIADHDEGDLLVYVSMRLDGCAHCDDVLLKIGIDRVLVLDFYWDFGGVVNAGGRSGGPMVGESEAASSSNDLIIASG
ncbi:hypothetical protein HPB49_003626 [Dermacentor silvarum]|uniref:Uncharacterized protein n=1 Tax=Dermacentor silvarum TaxID=543639 RepID=A0ACB8CP73_DERSI|nr:hypothetical protein HPB49_003626 [Dermacentor silvarum]